MNNHEIYNNQNISSPRDLLVLSFNVPINIKSLSGLKLKILDTIFINNQTKRNLLNNNLVRGGMFIE